MGKVFFSKKQKAQMRERRKKKKLSQATKEGDQENADPSNTDETTQRQDINDPAFEGGEINSSKKRQREDSADAETNDEEVKSANTKKQKMADLKTKNVNGNLHVLVPSTLSGKLQKKFRKDARRQLRLEGKDDSNIEFVVTSPEEFEKASSSRGGKKKSFPSIKELLQQKKQMDQLKKEEDKIQQKIHQIPEDVKAQYVALDCEMVGIGTTGKKSALARVSMVGWDLNTILDTYVKVPIRVTDFRTHVSGVEPKHIKSNAMDEKKCRELVAELLQDKILVGHALSNDLKALLLTHPKSKIRDTAKYRPFQRFGNGKWRPRKLRDLVRENLKEKEGFQEAEHDSVEDAKATMQIFQLVHSQWEKEVSSKTN